MNETFSAEERRLIGSGAQASRPASLRGCYPVVMRDDRLWWRDFGEKRFSEPFFHDTLAHLDNRRHLQTGFDALTEFDQALPLSGIIFHTSRCGSTLLCQMLDSLPCTVVISEPPIIDACLGLRGHDTARLLTDIVAVLGQRRSADESHFFIKLDSWHIASLPLFRRAFPDTPFLFLYRDPGAVLASHRRLRGRQMVPGLVDIPGLEADDIEAWDLDAYAECVLTHFFSEACRHADALMLIEYGQLPEIAWQRLPELFSIPASPAQIETMRVRSRLHAKTGLAFTADPERPLPASCRALYECYEKLEHLRQERDA